MTRPEFYARNFSNSSMSHKKHAARNFWNGPKCQVAPIRIDTRGEGLSTPCLELWSNVHAPPVREKVECQMGALNTLHLQPTCCPAATSSSRVRCGMVYSRRKNPCIYRVVDRFVRCEHFLVVYNARLQIGKRRYNLWFIHWNLWKKPNLCYTTVGIGLRMKIES